MGFIHKRKFITGVHIEACLPISVKNRYVYVYCEQKNKQPNICSIKHVLLFGNLIDVINLLSCFVCITLEAYKICLYIQPIKLA